jgi:hypothetical protein
VSGGFVSGLAWDLSLSLRQNSTVGLKKVYKTYFFPLLNVVAQQESGDWGNEMASAVTKF